MAIPGFKECILPMPKALKQHGEMNNKQLFDRLADEMGLTEEDRNQYLPSRREKLFGNRLGWAKIHLKEAGLITKPSKNSAAITERGLSFLKDAPSTLDTSDFLIYPEYQEFRERCKPKNPGGKKPLASDEHGNTPIEQMELGYQQISDELASEMLATVKDASPYFFEQIVVDLLLAMGYGGTWRDAGRVTRPTADGGIDGIINEDKLGLDVIYLQAKKWQNPVSRPEIQKFAGALLGKKASKGVFITTSSFTKSAMQYVKNIESSIILIDGGRLAELMIEHDVGVSVSQVYKIKRIDTDYFNEA